MTLLFQPTRPLRGATQWNFPLVYKAEFQPTRPLRGATAWSFIAALQPLEFQPTRPLRGATTTAGTCSIAGVFQPTRPLRGATIGKRSQTGEREISTHAPLAGRDGHR